VFDGIIILSSLIERGNRVRKWKKPMIITALCCILLFIGYLNTSYGKLHTVRFRGYSEIEKNVYIDSEVSEEVRTEMRQLIEDSRSRTESFWRNLESEPVFILSEDQQKLEQPGSGVNSAATRTFVYNGVKTYILIVIPKVSIDILAHEMSHAELHKRIYDGKLFSSRIIPVWFDEGLAMQVDYREKYGEEAWEQLMKPDSTEQQFAGLATSEQFFSGNTMQRTAFYIMSRHDVKLWYEENGHDQLLELIKGVNAGKKFDDLYYMR